MDQPQITPDIVVANIFTHWPKTVHVFLKHNMSCVGCSMAKFEPLHIALDIYGLPVQEFIDELYAVIDS